MPLEKNLVIDEKHMKVNKRPEDLPEFNIEEIDNKIVCKICFENESDIELIPCGHSLCQKCLKHIYELKEKQLKLKYKSKRLIAEKTKQIQCPKYRQNVRYTNKLYH